MMGQLLLHTLPLWKWQSCQCSWKLDNNWMNNQEFNLDVEEEYLLTKYDTLINYIKQLYLHFSVVIRDGRPHNKDMLRSMIVCLDRSVEDYNNYLLNRRNVFNEFLEVSALSLIKQGKDLAPKIYEVVKNEAFQMEIIFTEDQNAGYRMHCEIWKYEERGKSSNRAITKFEQTFMAHLKEKMIQEGMIEEVTEHGFKVKDCKPRIANNTNIVTKKMYTDRFLNIIKNEAKEFLRKMRDREPCPYCRKYQLFENKYSIFLPPTCILDNSIRDKNQYKFFHETCIIRTLKRHEPKGLQQPQPQLPMPNRINLPTTTTSINN